MALVLRSTAAVGNKLVRGRKQGPMLVLKFVRLGGDEG